MQVFSSCGKERKQYITGVKDKPLADLDNLPDPDELATDIVDNLEETQELFKAEIALLNSKQ